MNTIKTWQERAGLDRHDERPYMRAEIEELRAALAARATPAQPVPSPSSVGAAIHYPECWDVAAYPTLESALNEIYVFFKCSNDECANASEAAALAEQVPEGCVLVPTEPTAEMIAACDFSPAILSAVSKPAFVAAYKCMVAAAPSIAKDGQKSEGA